MSRRIADHIRSNVVGYVAVFLALTGVSYAASLPANSVKSKTIKNGQVKTKDIAGGAVTSSDLAAGSVGTAAVQDNSLTGVDIDESSLSGVNAAQVGGLAAPQLQRRISGGCPAGGAIRSVNPDGTVACETGTGGDITEVTRAPG